MSSLLAVLASVFATSDAHTTFHRDASNTASIGRPACPCEAGMPF
jgi:hypothetical protein